MKQYTDCEKRVCDYLQELTPDIGCGDDPIGFLIASHEVLRLQRNKLLKIKEEFDKIWD